MLNAVKQSSLMYDIAVDVLTIAARSAASERVFSRANTLNTYALDNKTRFSTENFFDSVKMENYFIESLLQDGPITPTVLLNEHFNDHVHLNNL
uniref:HAT C-terminal dimerisation domain-containing protein n=1 Tax=Romanomermis culicivorax TaxID=13658 RepID=A0A915JJY8_ROMCU